jgi:DNA-directed RNA polymerase I subunit RPA12
MIFLTSLLDTASRTIVTKSKPSDFPSLLRRKLSSVQTVERHKIKSDQVDPNMDCPVCGRTGIRYSEVQLRSADEGSTIIYNCECGYRWNMNN